MKLLCEGLGITSFDVRGSVLIVDDAKKSYTEYLSDCVDKIVIVDVASPAVVLILKNAKAFISRCGGITCHAATLCRELNIPAVVGASKILDSVKPNMIIRIKSENGKGVIYEIDSV